MHPMTGRMAPESLQSLTVHSMAGQELENAGLMSCHFLTSTANDGIMSGQIRTGLMSIAAAMRCVEGISSN